MCGRFAFHGPRPRRGGYTRLMSTDTRDLLVTIGLAAIGVAMLAARPIRTLRLLREGR